jgi:SpoVK/Ycf46/Vps4 family AAA+-type ATPase
MTKNKKRSNSILSDSSDKNLKKKKISEPEPVIIINKEIKSLDDLIELGLTYEVGKKYNINLEKLNKITPLLIKLKNVIGMESVKKSIIGQIIYFLQDFQNKNEDMLHTVIQGPPGVGKTMLGHIIGQIYWELDIIESPNETATNTNNCCDDDADDDADDDYDDDDYDYYDDYDYDDIKNFKNIIKTMTKNTRSSTKKREFKFKIAKRSDLIGKYLGHTAAQTQKVIDSALGGVLFIDEAYSLGNPEGRDSFAKECIDTINQNLTEKKNQLLVIIAGYEDALNSCFFSYNEGLNRRFPFRYTIDSYSYEEIGKIFVKMVEDINKEPGFQWSVDISSVRLNQFFKDNYKLFPNFGGDVETFLLGVKIQHGIRVFCLPTEVKKKITIDDLINALKLYRVNKEIKGMDMKKYIYDSMYV